MIEQVRQYMEQWNMTEPGDTVAVGLSGGADSVCLFQLLGELAEQMRFTLLAVHVEHGIRGEESMRDEQFVRRLCEAHGIPLVVSHVDVPMYAAKHQLGTEEAARLLRYEVFEGLQADGARIRVALAHHMEDNAETMLMALARGTGLDGLCGIPPVREGGVCYIRPLLPVSRQAIEEYLAARGQDFCADSTNSDTKYARNYIRSEVLPSLLSVNPQAVVHMNRTAAQLTELRAYLDRETDALYAQIVSIADAHSSREGALYMNAGALSALPAPLQKRVIHRAVGEAAGGRKDIGAVHIEAVLSLLKRQSGRRIELPCGLAAVREYDRIVLWAAGQMSACSEIAVCAEQLGGLLEQGTPCILPLGAPGEELELSVFPYTGNSKEISIKMYTKWFDYDMIKDGFLIRGRKPGDYFVMKDGHRKKLSDYLIDEKYPAGLRDEIKLLAAGQEVLWMIGGRMGRSAMVTKNTRTVLAVTYRGVEHGA